MQTEAKQTFPKSHDAPGPKKPQEAASPRESMNRSIRFWGIFVALCMIAFICALDVAVITTALPTITEAVGGGTQYVWIANSFVVASAVVQPLFSQLADVFGRRVPLAISLTLFLLGSGIAGGSFNAAMLIAGRTIQGIGAGGLYVLTDIVCCDLVPLRERGKYVGLMNSFSGVAAAIGPVIGGALAQHNWRWIFYMNLPICGFAWLVFLAFMRMKTGQEALAQQSTTQKLQRVDYLGSLIFIPSILALLLGLVMGGIQHPWSSWQIILPIVLGVVGWAVFHLQQSYFASWPSVPARLFQNRTSLTVYLLTFTSSVIVQQTAYFLPVYFQAVKGTSALTSGTNFLPFAIGTLAFAVVGGVMLSKFGAYRPIHAVSFALSAVGFGLFTILDGKSKPVAWVFFQLIASAGSGFTMATFLPAIMAALPESDVATATGAYGFIRTFGYIWGVSIPAVIFNSVVNSNLWTISDRNIQDSMRDGKAYAYASEIRTIHGATSESLRDEISYVYIEGLKAIWWLGLGLSLASFLCVGFEKGLELRTELETEYGINEVKRTEELGESGGEVGRPKA
ncbi:major facilitator superfamily domain-containing protein [Apiospora marii]|uniref:Major facilitator superfamily domain-containing protein n=1 Tax=Apiospora marii TaxID=335849 RepID=A0ABR1R5N0_9PEZI